ncbi:transposase-like protein, IS1381 ISSpn7 [Streptococcus pneumoniae]|nr:transposase-like protein, IS1381 ISSpn7 [Streptococcus pneumoniae]
MKAQAIVTSQGRIVSLDIAVNYCHDMKLFKMSRRNIGQAGKILADSGYQGLMKIYPQAQTPRKSSKLKPLTVEDKAYNHALSKERSKVENIFAKVKTFKMFSTTYRNHRKRFGLRMNLIAGIINDEASKQLTDARFKRLVGVQRTTFEEILAVLKTAYQLKHAKGGRKPNLSLEDLLMATLQYVREYRTYEQIAADFGIHESNLIRRSQWVEVTLVQSGVTISRTPLSSEDTVMIDATEVQINRPKRRISELFW